MESVLGGWLGELLVKLGGGEEGLRGRFEIKEKVFITKL